MKLPLLAVVAGLAFAAVAVQAQNQPLAQPETQSQYETQHKVAIYLNPVFSRISNPADTGVFAFLGPGTTSRMFYGWDLGSYDDFLHSHSSDIGVDVRGSFLRGNGAHLNSFLVGPRFVFKPQAKLKPYVEGLIGVARSRAATNPRGLSSFQYGVLGGADYSFSPHVDFRMVEIGYNAAQTIGSGVFTGNGGSNILTSKMINISTGLVFRFK
ncbi:hypothetical protein GCM10011507_29090 [Edaphobacter acidisoli]|uniref:Outer membrane protein beta-barrel domain-containing protein n=1 Tax=Edaphobacter acidisoli TaxID=2040573 RepID=A0A916RZZ8_9BACT|nr:hypothetical protein [Edaphobacter acidisoli]GGA75893.1 hypothetical protein GCM10011507_29090 [Edaphobacter acidisoli]